MSILDWAIVVFALAAAAWWVFARRRGERGLDVLSAAAAALSLLAFPIEGIRWQVLPWQALGLLVASAAALRRWRPRPLPKAARVLAVVLTAILLLVGGLFMMFVPVPSLPAPRGAHLVGSETFRWTDAERSEAFTADPTDRREVIAQAWYPADAASAERVPYFEAQGRLPGSVLGLPAWYYQRFDEVVVPATDSPAISRARATFPVIIFEPGLNNARESYTSLAADLASDGLVVIALTHPYEAGVAVLSDGRVVGQTISLFDGSASSAQILDTREADVRFVLDKLGSLAAEDPSSPLAGRLDVDRVALVGHSLGGATATQVLANDSRFVAGVNLDGTLFNAQPGLRLRQPFMWVQSDGMHMPSYLKARDDLFGNLQGGGAVLRIEGSAHNDFTDGSSYLGATGRLLLGGLTGTGALSHVEAIAATSDAIQTFLARPLGLGGPGDLEQLHVAHPSVEVERIVPPADRGRPGPRADA